MDIINKFVENSVKTNYDCLPSNIVETVKKSIIDTLGCIIAGSIAKGCDVVANQFFKWGGREESTVLEYNKKIPCADAAFLNGMMGRILEIDDCADAKPMHPSVSIIPASLALSEAIGGVSGKRFITSVALGHDIMFRMAFANKYTVLQTGRYNMFKIFAPALSCSKILQQDSKQTLNTLGLAYTLMVGDAQCGLDGAFSLNFQQGHVAKSGVISAIFGSKGITGAKNILQGRFGYYNAFDTEQNLDVLIKDLGKEFHGKYISIKPYSCCRSIHSSIDCIFEIIKENNLTKDDIKKIDISVSKAVKNIVGIYSIPQNLGEALYSIPYNVACAIVFNDVFLEEHREKNFSNQDIINLINRINIIEKKGM